MKTLSIPRFQGSRAAIALAIAIWILFTPVWAIVLYLRHGLGFTTVAQQIFHDLTH